ncbi:MAG: hypothetical protein HQL09_02335 [Nitrospirae bacterium]|nr:hypothetical protein [Nitrospirota bacterium]
MAINAINHAVSAPVTRDKTAVNANRKADHPAVAQKNTAVKNENNANRKTAPVQPHAGKTAAKRTVNKYV